MANDILCFTAEQINSSVSLIRVGQPEPITLVYSTNGMSWEDYTIGQIIRLNAIGDKVYIRAKLENNTINSTWFDTKAYRFQMSGIISASGNIQYLLDPTGQRQDVPDFCFNGLFYDCQSLINAPQMLGSRLGRRCYLDMYNGSSITSIDLPAKVLNDSSYYAMTAYCSNIIRVKTAHTAWQPANATSYWLDNSSLTGDFYCNVDLPIIRDNTHIPSGWNIHQLCTITYSTEYGNKPEDSEVEINTAITFLPEMEDTEEKMFFGWWYEDNTQAQVGDILTDNTLLTAKWYDKPTPPPEPNLKGNRFDETYEFTRVKWENWQEHENYNYILSGNIEKSTESDLKITGSFQFEGYEIPEVNDLIRVYYSFLDDNNVSFRRPIATFLVSYANLQLVDTLEGVKASGTLDGASVLSVLANKLSGRPYTIKKNENAIYKASQIIRELGLQVNYEPSSFCLGKYQTFEGGTSYLEIVNWLLDSAGYRHAYPDEYGVIQLLPLTYKVMEDGEEVVTDFTNDSHSIMLPEVDEANDWQSTPNVVRLLYNIDDACIVAYAKNIRGTRASLSARGNREITEFQEVSELGTGDRANNLKVMAENMLRELSSDIEFVTLKHAYVPLTLYDKVSINYDDYSWTGTLETMSIDLSPSTETQTRIKRTIYQEIEIESRAEILR